MLRQHIGKGSSRTDLVCWNSASREERSGKSVRLQFCGIVPDEAGWNDVNFLVSELLRDEFNPKNIVRLEFWAQPDVDEENDRVEAEIFTSGAARLHAIRAKPKRYRPPNMDRPKTTTGTGEVVQFSVGEDFGDLDEKDRALLARFNRLPLQRRIRFWQEHIAPHFK